MSVRIIDAWVQSGWTNCDHMLDHDSVRRVVGRVYRSAREAIRAAEAAGDKRAEVAVHYADLADDGFEWVEGSELDLPGRPHLKRQA